jgi:hypothetical protein
VARCVLRLLLTANTVSSPLILSTLLMEAIRSSKKSALTRTTQRNTPEDGILHHIYLLANENIIKTIFIYTVRLRPKCYGVSLLVCLL